MAWNPFKKDFWEDGNFLDPAHLILDDPKDAAAEREMTETQRRDLEGLRGRVPGRVMSERELFESPEFLALLQRRNNGEMTPEEFERQAQLLRNQPNTVEYEGVDRDELDLIDPEYIGDRLQGYDAATVDGTAFDNLDGQEERARLGGVQQTALDRVLGISNEGGLNAIDRARIAEQQEGEEQWLRGQRGATTAQMQARGLGGSGLELADIFDQQQGAANRNANRGVQIEGMAQQRQDQALRDAFGMSSSQRDQSFGEASRVADARDVSDRWNSQLTTDAARFRAEERNRGIENDVRIHNDAEAANTGITNDNTVYNNDLVNAGIDATNDEAWRHFGADQQITGGQTGATMQGLQMGMDRRAGQRDTARQVGGMVFGGLASRAPASGQQSAGPPQLEPIGNVEKVGATTQPDPWDDEDEMPRKGAY